MKQYFSAAFALLGLGADFSAASAAEFTATNCEIFIEKIQVTRPSGRDLDLNLLLRVHPALLDSGLKTVRALDSREVPGALGADYTNREVELPQFFDAENTFSYRVKLKSNNYQANYQVAFYAETEAGTRYWLNSENVPGWNFFFNRGTLHFLDSMTVSYRAFDLNFVSPTWEYPDEAAAVFNPRFCN